jgi:hypothetical protein
VNRAELSAAKTPFTNTIKHPPMIITLRPSKKDRTGPDLKLIKQWCDDNQVPLNRLLNSVIKALAHELRDTDYQNVYPILLQVKLPEKLYGRNQYWTEQTKNKK